MCEYGRVRKVSKTLRRLLTDERHKAQAGRHGKLLDDLENDLSGPDRIRRITAEHELELLEALSESALREAVLEYKIPSGKRVDVFLAQTGIAIEAYSPVLDKHNMDPAHTYKLNYGMQKGSLNRAG